MPPLLHCHLLLFNPLPLLLVLLLLFITYFDQASERRKREVMMFFFFTFHFLRGGEENFCGQFWHRDARFCCCYIVAWIEGPVLFATTYYPLQ